MAQNKGEGNATSDSVEQPESSQTETTATTPNSDAQADKATEALAKLEAELATEKEQEVKQSEKVETERAKPKKRKASKAENVSSDSSLDNNFNENKATQPSQVVKSRSWLAVFAFLFSLIAIAGVAFIWWQSQVWLKNQEQMEQLKQQSLLNTQQTLNQQQAQITDLLTKLSQQQNNQQTVQQSLDSMQSRIKELGESQPNYWLAAEANYLINLAERRLLIEQDAGTAMRLLVDANMRLAAMQDPSVFHIRTAISQDIAALKVVNQPNTDDIYLALSGLLGQVPALPFAQVYIPQPNQVQSEAAQVSDNIDDWQDNLMVSVERFFAHFVTIRKQEMQVQPQLPADQQWFVRANINTELLMAQNAVLDKNQQRYLDAISIINQWSQQYFDQSKPEVVAFVNNLAHLSKQDVELVLPGELAAQALIANYVIEQLQLKEQTPVEEPNND